MTFSETMGELYECGALEGADLFVFCASCDDITEAWSHDADFCSHCGFCVPDHAPRGRYERSN